VPTPTIVLDFTTRTVGLAGVDPDASQKLRAALAAQKDVLVLAGGSPPVEHDD